jgi:iron-sulfur cluster assembly accessory protein
MTILSRPPPITVTDSAVARAAYLISKSDHPVAGIRVGIETKGCSGFAYKVEYADEQGKFEDVVEQNGIKFFIDPMAVMYLLGSELDYLESKMESGFVFTNPNETGRCGCGESFSAAPNPTN